jgi:hypothetical protein
MAVTPQAGRAIDEAWALAALRRSRRRGWLAILGFVVLFGVVGTFANVFVGGSEHLRETGDVTTGVIVGGKSFRVTHDSSVDVAYSVDGHRFEEEVALGNHAGDYSAGQQVTVYYDPSDPSKMTIDDINNEPAWTVLPMAVGFVGGACLLIGGIIALVSVRRKRTLLERCAWQDATVLPSKPAPGYVYLRTEDTPLLRASLNPATVTDEPRVRVAGADRRYLAVTGEAPTALARARPPKSDREERLWRAQLTADSAP